MVNQRLPLLNRSTSYTRKFYDNSMRMLIIITLYIGVMTICGCDHLIQDIPPNVNNVSDLDDPSIRSEIFDVAIKETSLRTKLFPSGEKVYYAPKQDQPFTGWVKNNRKLQQFQNGKKHGIYISWYGNWERAEQGQYKNGFRDGVWIQWNPIGGKESEGTNETQLLLLYN